MKNQIFFTLETTDKSLYIDALCNVMQRYKHRITSPISLKGPDSWVLDMNSGIPAIDFQVFFQVNATEAEKDEERLFGFNTIVLKEYNRLLEIRNAKGDK